MKTIKTLIAAAALATVSTATFAADDSPAAQRVQHAAQFLHYFLPLHA